MFFYVIIFILVFLIIFSFSFFFLILKELIIDNLYLIIPAICIGLWAYYSLLLINEAYYRDFKVFYRAGKQFLSNPGKLYDISGFVYMPIMAIFFAFSISTFPFSIAYYIFFFINYIWGVLSIREYNKILILKDIKEKFHRFLFLIIISNGNYVAFQFLFNQTKYLLFVIFLFIIRRELQFNKEGNIKNLKFYLINYGLFVFAIGMAPYFIFLLIIYMFHNIPLKEFFYKENIKEYSIVIIMFIAQNFLFIIYISQFFIFINFYFVEHQRVQGIQRLLYLRGLIVVTPQFMAFLTILFTIILIVISLILSFNSRILIEEKFGLFCLAFIFLGVFSHQIYLYLLLFSFVLLLYVPYLNQTVNGIEFIKSNKIVILGLVSIIEIFNDFITFNLNPKRDEYLFIILYNSKLIFLLSIIMISLILSIQKKNRNLNTIVA